MTAPLEETRAQPVEVTCPGCFHPREWDIAGVCPICHYRAGLEGRSGALLPVGTQLKGYVVGEKLGQGGFGITYRGFDVTLKMKVAIKEYYPSELVGRSTDRKTVVLNAHDHEDLFHYGLRTFLQEAQTVAQLRHPHLVRVLNYFELNDTAYLVMDYYEGEDLARHLKPAKGQTGVQMPWRRALKLLLPVLDGLQKVHQAGFMHRDLKPGNLYLTPDDDLIVLDFGSARQVTGTHTRSLLIFSEGYAPYEQYLQGHLNRQGPWTDVYGAAATLYFMLTARRLPSALERKQNDLLGQPDPLHPARHWMPDLPEALDAALRRALAVEPGQRFQSMVEFKRPLEAVLTAEEPTRPTPPKPTAAPEPPIKPPPKPKVAPEPPKSKAAPEPSKAAPKPSAVPERSAMPKQQTAIVGLAVIGLTALGGWWLWEEFGVSPKLPATPGMVAPPVLTPPVTESPPTVAPPVVEPRAYWTVEATPGTAQIRIMNINPAYRD
ncbi:MAG: serine/threonine protein kinase, partial [Candidatus Contendobacter sp.]